MVICMLRKWSFFTCFVSAICVAFFSFSGCVSKNSYVEGTMLQLGAYLPVDGNLFGVQVVNYLSGCSVKSSTNQTFSVEREYSSTNSYFGIVNTSEKTKTKVEVNKK